MQWSEHAAEGEADAVDVRNLAVSRMYLLKTIVLELRAIQVLQGD